MFGVLEAHLWTSNFTPMVPPVPLGRERDMDWLSGVQKQNTVRLFYGLGTN